MRIYVIIKYRFMSSYSCICSYIEVLEYIETFLVNLFMAILFTIGYIAFIDRCLNVYLST